ncbi:MAG: (deoxy)nucleoside triphosphate pyrophosphohydrolase [Prevotella sp.]|nr:(deoxy)nucleoside triphosphate pyrophosphohydrolase [Prevotella sp.]
MEKKHYNVVAAVVKDGDKYLCMQRTRSRFMYISERWEFPGGKVEEGENDYEALIREIAEEMDWDVYVGRKLGTVDHEYPDFSITLTAYLCKKGDRRIKLYEHLDYQWLTCDEMNRLRWTEADAKLLEILPTEDAANGAPSAE